MKKNLIEEIQLMDDHELLAFEEMIKMSFAYNQSYVNHLNDLANNLSKDKRIIKLPQGKKFVKEVREKAETIEIFLENSGFASEV